LIHDPPQSHDSKAVANDLIVDLLPAIESALEEACQWTSACPARLGEAIRYSLLAPGKRVRPALALMACEAVGGNRQSALAGAVAVEMVHAYSLVHDDLPAMDDDDLRRGRPTTHIRFDEATAILAGDALLAMSFEHLARQVADPVLGHRCISILARAAGPECLVGGQSDDLAAESMTGRGSADASEPRGDAALPSLEAIHRRKTGALIDASVAIGAILGGANQQALSALQNYSRPLGLAFQVVDDCLDHSATDVDMGKRTGKDAARGKLTYPGLLGLAEARRYADRLVEESLAAIEVFGSDARRLRWLAGFVRDRTR
jgi:geranylgeranyl diphosphate synthase, type II